MSHARYLELLDQGYDPDQAARRSGYTPRGQKPPRVLVRPRATEEQRAWKSAGDQRAARKVTPAAVVTRVELPTVTIVPVPRPVGRPKQTSPRPVRPTPPDLTDGLCRQVDAELFFPEQGGGTRDAKRVCGRCPVQQACLDDALATGERFGVRGGLSERERRALAKHLGRGAA